MRISIIVTLWLFNIAMENGPFLIGKPLFLWAISHGYVSHNQMVPWQRTWSNGSRWPLVIAGRFACVNAPRGVETKSCTLDKDRRVPLDYRMITSTLAKLIIGIIQCGAPKIAKLVYNSNNYGLWFMVLITIVNGVYKPTYNWGAPHCRYII